ncbi:hypothetical protein [Mesorhizobium carmichaelinearum]|uniref:hypothetical protein n=1 Tax=Mesorhizobium carmichaelinearum TaxID=1208188 RepID=UPI001FCE9A56|nr:hypothetical protein [Mesorhizobium carmichaelinearum]
MSSNLRAALRRYKPEKNRARLAPRTRGRPVGVTDISLTGRPTLVPEHQHLYHGGGGHTAGGGTVAA